MARTAITVIDYGMGNIRSVSKALESAGAKVTVTSRAKEIESCDAVVLPGVGSFAPAVEYLKKRGIETAIKCVLAEKKHFLGICLGFQLLFDLSMEQGVHKGLGIISGSVVKFSSGAKKDNIIEGIKIPHMGWNTVKFSGTDTSKRMFKDIPDKSYFYFVHSYYAVPKEKKIINGLTNYGDDFCSAIVKDRIWACQFHPEKSGQCGLQLLRNFVNEIN